MANVEVRPEFALQRLLAEVTGHASQGHFKVAS